MDASKRNFLMRSSAGLSAIVLGSLVTRHVSLAHSQVYRPPLPTTQNANTQSSSSPQSDVGGDPKEMLKHHQLQIHDDVEKLYELAGELKADVEKTQTEHVLSLGMIQKAEQIEKLAKQVKTMARES